MATFIVFSIVVAVVGWSIKETIKSRKSGGCGCDCNSCKGSCK